MADRRLPARQGVDFRVGIVCQLSHKDSLSRPSFLPPPRDFSLCLALVTTLQLRVFFIPGKLQLCLGTCDRASTVAWSLPVKSSKSARIHRAS